MRLKTKKPTEPGHRPPVRTDGPQLEVKTDPLSLIDEALARYARPRLVSTREVVDVLLDLRSAVVLDASFASLLEDLDRVRNSLDVAVLPLREPY